jgi:hypothetical protein
MSKQGLNTSSRNTKSKGKSLASIRNTEFSRVQESAALVAADYEDDSDRDELDDELEGEILSSIEERDSVNDEQPQTDSELGIREFQSPDRLEDSGDSNFVMDQVDQPNPFEEKTGNVSLVRFTDLPAKLRRPVAFQIRRSEDSETLDVLAFGSNRSPINTSRRILARVVALHLSGLDSPLKGKLAWVDSTPITKEMLLGSKNWKWKPFQPIEEIHGSMVQSVIEHSVAIEEESEALNTIIQRKISSSIGLDIGEGKWKTPNFKSFGACVRTEEGKAKQLWNELTCHFETGPQRFLNADRSEIKNFADKFSSIVEKACLLHFWEAKRKSKEGEIRREDLSEMSKQLEFTIGSKQVLWEAFAACMKNQRPLLLDTLFRLPNNDVVAFNAIYLDGTTTKQSAAKSAVCRKENLPSPDFFIS